MELEKLLRQCRLSNHPSSVYTEMVSTKMILDLLQWLLLVPSDIIYVHLIFEIEQMKGYSVAGFIKYTTYVYAHQWANKETNQAA